MLDEKQDQQIIQEFNAEGQLFENGVRITERSSIDSLSQRGYGTIENNTLILNFYEALYLIDKEILKTKNKKNNEIDFRTILSAYQGKDENAWLHYIVYRDLRSRGYVVREGIGANIDFRIYERGTYGKGSASQLVMSTQEGKPVPIEEVANAMTQSQKLKKELILAVTNRRGEIVYYSVSPLTFK